MAGNKALQAELSESLANIRNALTLRGHTLYQNELDNLATAINQSLDSNQQGSTFFRKHDVVKCIMIIINKIDKETKRLEKEMRGIQNFPSISKERVEDIKFKQTIKNELTIMRDKIISARHERKDEDVIRLTRELK